MRIYPDEQGNCPEEYSPLPFVAATNDKAAARAMWASVEMACWVRAAKALAARDFSLMRANAQQAQYAAKMATPNSALLDAIFGPNAGPVDPDDKLVREGSQIEHQMASTAKQLVTAEISAHATRVAAQQAQVRATAATARRTEQAAQAAQVADQASAALAIGAEYRAEVPYALIKSSGDRMAGTAGLCRVNGITVAIVGGSIKDGETVVIKSLRQGRSWGVKYVAEGAVV